MRQTKKVRREARVWKKVKWAQKKKSQQSITTNRHNVGKHNVGIILQDLEKSTMKFN